MSIKKTPNAHSPGRKWPMPVTLSSALFLMLILAITLRRSNSSSATLANRNLRSGNEGLGLPNLPRFAYLISGTKGEIQSLRRVLQAAYHPRNYYLLHLDSEAADSERLELAEYVKSENVIREFKNVMVVGKADMLTYKGPTMVASTLHAIAILLMHAQDWDWFINLSASDYPLLPQDDLLHVFSFLPGDLNFLDHSSNLGWKEEERARPIVIDPGLYRTKKSGLFWAREKRSMPSSFKLFMGNLKHWPGSPWVVLTKSFLEFCIWGWENLPRTLLMYYTNFFSSPEAYFHTVICNHKDYQNTTVNHDMRFVKWDDTPSKPQPLNLTMEHWDEMVQSGAPFARGFSKNDRVLDEIDAAILRRSDGKFTPGGWCLGNSGLGKDPCLVYGSPSAVKPAAASKRLEKFILELLAHEKFRSRQCK